MPGKSQVGHDYGRRIRELVRQEDIAVSFTAHAEQEMRADGITRVDVLTILRGGMVIGSEIRRGEWCHAMEGRTTDGTTVIVVVAIHEDQGRLRIITVYVKRKGGS